MTRVVLVTGKGGVGKTTVAAATAVHAARLGARVLVTSTDPAHSLGDVLDVSLSNDVRRVAPGLRALQLDGRARLEEHWLEVRDYLVELLAAGGLGHLQARELVMVPGLDELFALLDLEARVAADDYDLVVVDCAPTAETLRLLALPEAMAFYVDRLLGPGRRLARLVRPVSRSVAGVPVPGDEVFATVNRIQARLATVRQLLTDPAQTSVRLVLTPERLVVAEALRMATTLSLFGHTIDAVVVNRVLPVDDPAWARWNHGQQEHLATVDAAFSGLARLRVGLSQDEPVGIEPLARLGRELHGELDPRDVLSRGDQFDIVALEDGHHLVRLPVPFAVRDDIDLHRRDADLHVVVGAAKRVVRLPDALADHQVKSAFLVDGHLEVRLGPKLVEVAS